MNLRYFFTNTNLKYLESISKCIEMNWMCILVGPSCAGKTTLVRMLANLLGVNLVEFSVNNATDTSDLLGGFEKVKHRKSLILNAYEQLRSIYSSALIVRNSYVLMKSYFEFLFEAKLIVKSRDEDLDENRDKAIAALNLFKKNLEILNSFKLDG